MSTMHPQHIRRLWGGSVPVLTTNLVLSGSVCGGFNDALNLAAIRAFDVEGATSEMATHRRAGPDQPGDDDRSSSPRRRRLRGSGRSSRTSGHGNASQGVGGGVTRGVTRNDVFFAHQQNRGYRLAFPAIASCAEARLLEQEHAVKALLRYLEEFDSPAARSVAAELSTTQSSLSVDLWAAVQRGPGARHADHVHEGAVVSGVYYSGCPDGCAPLVLKGRKSLGSNGIVTSLDSEEVPEDDEVAIHPTEGQLVLFPPWVLHGVPPSTEADGERPRVSWAFNLAARRADIDAWSITLPSADQTTLS